MLLDRPAQNTSLKGPAPVMRHGRDDLETCLETCMTTACPYCNQIVRWFSSTPPTAGFPHSYLANQTLSANLHYFGKTNSLQ